MLRFQTCRPFGLLVCHIISTDVAFWLLMLLIVAGCVGCSLLLSIGPVSVRRAPLLHHRTNGRTVDQTAGPAVPPLPIYFAGPVRRSGPIGAIVQRLVNICRR